MLGGGEGSRNQLSVQGGGVQVKAAGRRGWRVPVRAGFRHGGDLDHSGTAAGSDRLFFWLWSLLVQR